MNNEKKLSVNIEKFLNIIERYRNGEFGDKYMTLAEILDAANEKELINQMNITEIQYLINNSSGITKMMFLELKKRKINDEDQVKSPQLARKI